METTAKQIIPTAPIPIDAVPLSAADVEIQFPMVKVKAISDRASSRYQGMWCFYMIEKEWYILNRRKINVIFPSFAVVQMSTPFVSDIALDTNESTVSTLFETHYALLPIWRFYTQQSYYSYNNILLPKFIGSNINNRGTHRRGLQISTYKIKMLDLSVDGIFMPTSDNFFIEGVAQDVTEDVTEMIEATQIYITEHINEMLMGLGMGEGR